jgi:VanZ family protein
LYAGLLASVSLMPVQPGSQLGSTSGRRTFNNLLHIPAYGVLAVVCVGSVGGRIIAPRASGSLGMGWLGAMAFGALMEFGQAFVPGRGCSVTDMALNATGATLGVIGLALVARLLQTNDSLGDQDADAGADVPARR